MEVSEKAQDNFGRYFLLVILTGLLILFFYMIKVFVLPILMAGVFATLLYPLYKWISRRLRGRRSLAAFCCCVIMFIGIFTPLYMIVNLVTKEAVQFYREVEQYVRQTVEQGDSGPLGKLQNSPWVKRFNLDKIDWPSTIQDFASTAGGFLAAAIRKTSGGALTIVANIFIILFICFYFFRDGEALMRKMRNLIPLRDEYQEAFALRFASVSRATIKGMVVIGFTQSVIGGITLAIFGVDSAFLWFVVMLVLSMIPVVGAWLVMHPAAIIQIVLGNIWQGIGIFAVTILVISNIDNVLRPKLVGQMSGLHDLLIFFSALGGIQVFGAMGVIIGPIIAAFFMTILEIYSKEFRDHLILSRQNLETATTATTITS